MTERLDPESIDLAEMADVVRTRCGASLPGGVTGRTLMRDQLASHLGCSELEAELIVDTMVARGFVKRREQPDGLELWEV